MRKNTSSEAFATPNDKRGFVMPRILTGLSIQHVQWLRGMVGAIRKDARTASDVFLTTMLHLLRVRTHQVVFLNPEGTKTMTATLRAHTAAPTSPQANTATIPADRLHAVLGAYNAANLASSYIERGNFLAARRKRGCAEFCVNGQFTAGDSLLVRKHND
ncbi:hypothetical protein, partial [Comamonas sp. MYb69]|uniref:hypothetical protein n=1 Tax=Comamonas sp. MYb69 TaxID=1848650 RepID=UPI0030B7E5B0